MAKDKTGKKTYRDRITALADEHDVASKRYVDMRDAQEKLLATENRALTDDEKTERASAKEDRDALAERISELRDERAQAKSVAEARRDAGLDEEIDASGNGHASVVSEPRTYGPGSPNSYFADFVRTNSPGFKGADEARVRMSKHATEVSSEVRKGSDEGKRARYAIQESHRGGSPSDIGYAQSELRDRFEAETRAGMDTGSTSGGSFVTPQYFVSDYAAYRQFGRIFVDAANKQALPDYGMEVYIPAVSNAAGVASQSSQNTGIDEQDPTALYLSSALNTLAGQVTVSQQLLDRAGPNFAFDKMVFDQLNRAYAVAVDQYVLTQSIATAGTITATTSFTVPYAFQKIGQSKAATVDAAGTVLPATHAFFTPARWEYISTESNTNGAPYVQPNYAGVFQAIAAGSAGMPIAEGDTGYKISGLPVFEDGNIPLQSTVDQTIVAHMPEVWVWEGDLVPRTIPQTYAQDLSVLLQLYAYVTCIVRYPLAVQAIQWVSNVSWPA
jgi:HK97 family phage major capsid protein